MNIGAAGKKNNLSIRSTKGFTLIELMIAVFAFSLIAYGVIALVSGIFLNSSQQSNLLAGSDQARKIAFTVVNELRNAVTASNGSFPLDTAEGQQLIFYSDIDSASGIERIRYFVQNGKLWKGITRYSGSLYNTTTEQSYIVQNDLANGANPVFLYYDGNYFGSSTQASLTQPVNITQVKFVSVNLKIFNKGGVDKTNFYTVTASGAIRNLKTNLGQ